MGIDLLIMISFALIILLLLVWGYSIIHAMQNKLTNHTKSFDKLMQLNYQLNKELGELKKEMNAYSLASKGASFSLEEITKRIDTRINETLATKVMPMLESLKRLESSVDEFENLHEERILDLEERTKSISKITPPSFEAEEDKIEMLFKAGQSPEHIARDLHIPINKVTMVLKIRHLV